MTLNDNYLKILSPNDGGKGDSLSVILDPLTEAPSTTITRVSDDPIPLPNGAWGMPKWKNCIQAVMRIVKVT